MLNTRQLDAFRCVMEAGGISRAAASMNLSQPAVSKLITMLEARLGFVLFRREHQRLVPTAEARVFYEATKSVFGQFNRLEHLASNLKRAGFGHLVVAGVPTAGLSVLPAMISQFQAERQDVSVSLQVQNTPKLIDLAISQQIDAAVSVLPVDDPAVSSENLFRGRWACVLPPGHRLARKDVILPADLAGEPFISLGDEDRMRHLIDDIFAMEGVARILRTSTQLSMAACEFVRVGAGVTLVDPLTAAAPTNADLVARPFDHPVQFELTLLTPSARPPSAVRDEFIAHLRREFAALARKLG
ncbi:LysR substrate-binding domain-containing protein [Bosea sp. BK604]|uniref:LysR substrate-binding domain-containing protein n=1 Tax=Bosea sp. BK604 TaxID=2512180 RepID=UPI0010445CF6|nr:LysR substrate-binding domain-containing protein [Bosea sp. BK604]